MPGKRFEELAAALAARDRELPKQLDEARPAFEALRQHAADCVQAFVRAARANGAEHLTHICVDPVEPDDKYVDCLQFRVRRGYWEVVCVSRTSKATVTLVGPFRRGKPERPCQDHPLLGDQAGPALEDLLLRLLREAAGE
jgi:hypothetical protein